MEVVLGGESVSSLSRTMARIVGWVGGEEEEV